MVDQPHGQEQAGAGGNRTVEEADHEQADHAAEQRPALAVPRAMIHAQTGLEYRVQAESQGQHAQGELGVTGRNLEDGARAQYHAGQAGTQDDQGETPLQVAFPEMAHGRPQSQCDARHLVGCQRHAKRQAEKNQHGKLDQAGSAPGQGGKPVGDKGSDEKDEMIGENHLYCVTPNSAGILT
jgi:hypothetical protein